MSEQVQESVMDVTYTSLLGDTFRAVGRGFSTIYVPVLVVLLPVFAGLGVLAIAGRDGAFGPDWEATYSGVAMAGFYLANLLAQATVTYATCQFLAGERPSVTASVRRGADRLLPVIGFSIAFTVLMMGGMMLFIVPGIIVACMYFVLIPVIVMEGSRGAFRRSAELTKGYRRQIFGASAVMGLFLVALQVPVWVAFGLEPPTAVGTMAQEVLSALGCGVAATLGAVTYARLVAMRPGTP